MQITISSRKTKVTPRLEEVISEKIGRLDRYLEGMELAEVHFSEERNPRISDKEVCEVTLVGHGHHVRCKVRAPDAYTAVDLAVEKLEKQLRKLKTKLLKRHHGSGSSLRTAPVVEEVLASEPMEPSINIVKTKRFSMVPMVPAEAAEQMDLVGHTFYFFTNADTGRASVVYRREDGDVGLIDEAE